MEEGIDTTSFQEFSANLEATLRDIKKLTSEDKLFRATKLHDSVLRSIKQYQETKGIASDDIDSIKKEVNAILGDEFEEDLRRQSTEMKAVLNILDSNDGWTLVRESSGIKSYYRHEEGEDLHSVKLTGLIESPLLSVLAVLYEIDLYRAWWPLSKEIKELRSISRYRKIIHMTVDLPWPMWNRDTLLYAYGVDNLEDDRLMICFRSCTEEEEEKYVGNLKMERSVRSTWKIGGMLMTPVSPTTTQVSLCVNADPKFEFVPTQVMNTFTRYLSPLMFEKLRHVTKNIEGTEWQRRMKNNPQVYEEIKLRLADHFRKEKANASQSSEDRSKSIRIEKQGAEDLNLLD